MFITFIDETHSIAAETAGKREDNTKNSTRNLFEV